MILTKHSINAKEFKVDTKNQSEIHGIKFTIDGSDFTILNVYSPQDLQLSLHSMNIPQQTCLVLGAFNSHSTSWGYKGNNNRGDE